MAISFRYKEIKIKNVLKKIQILNVFLISNKSFLGTYTYYYTIYIK